jgi:Protein of unknown function (DUF1257)
MSKFVQIKTELRDLTLVKKALDELKIQYRENARYVHFFSGFAGKVPLVVQNKGVQFGLREGDSGVYEIIGDNMQTKQIQAVMNPVQQRYAYHKVLTEVEKAGFALVEEQTGRDNVIRMTVRRWG